MEGSAPFYNKLITICWLFALRLDFQTLTASCKGVLPLSAIFWFGSAPKSRRVFTISSRLFSIAATRGIDVRLVVSLLIWNVWNNVRERGTCWASSEWKFPLSPFSCSRSRSKGHFFCVNPPKRNLYPCYWLGFQRFIYCWFPRMLSSNCFFFLYYGLLQVPLVSMKLTLAPFLHLYFGELLNE